MSKTNLYVDIHLLQDLPPANLNRDDTGSPKSARYGGVDRLRVSSQAWKRATRLNFADNIDVDSLGYRTRRVQDTLSDALVAAGVAEANVAFITAELLKPLKITASKKRGEESSYLLFLSRPQVARLAADVAAKPEIWDDAEALGKIDVPAYLGKGHSLDVALFGRMVAVLSQIKVDAAAQVSHALATHAAPTQFDYFTAVDDAQGTDETGAGMIGTVEFNSATLYRYATVNVPELISNMDDKDAAVAGLEQFIRSFALSMPSGKQNTFAAHSRPGLVWLVVRSDQPVNYMSAFERPVTADRDGYFAQSMNRLAEFVVSENGRWGDHPVAIAATYTDGASAATEAFGASLSFDEAIGATLSAVREALADE